MMFHNDNLSTLSAENYTYCKIWDRDDRDRDRDRDDYCVILPWFGDILEGTRKFISKVNNRFGLKPGVSIVTIATTLL